MDSSSLEAPMESKDILPNFLPKALLFLNGLFVQSEHLTISKLNGETNTSESNKDFPQGHSIFISKDCSYPKV